MSQLQKTCSVTNGSQVIAVPGADVSSRILKNCVFMLVGDLVPYTVAQNSTFDGAATQVVLTGAYQGVTNTAASCVFVTDYTYPNMIPVISQGDVGTAAIFSDAMYKVQRLITVASPNGLEAYQNVATQIDGKATTVAASKVLIDAALVTVVAANSAVQAKGLMVAASEVATTAAKAAATAAAAASAASKTLAASSAASATTSAATAKSAAITATVASSALVAALAEFRSVFIGSRPSNPTVDGNGNPLIEGAQYFNTTTDVLMIYASGAWESHDADTNLATQSAQAAATTAASHSAAASVSAESATGSKVAAHTSEVSASASASVAITGGDSAKTAAGAAEVARLAAASSASVAEFAASVSTAAASTVSVDRTAAAAAASAAGGSATLAQAAATAAAAANAEAVASVALIGSVLSGASASASSAAVFASAADVSKVAANSSKISAASSASSAAASASAASTSATSATSSKTLAAASASAAGISANSAIASKNETIALAAATVAAGSDAGVSATTATGAATVAAASSAEAVAAATLATTSALAATAEAVRATSASTVATTQADIASMQAASASSSSASASTSAGVASSESNFATTQAASAAASAVSSVTGASSASASANSATVQAQLANSQATISTAQAVISSGKAVEAASLAAQSLDSAAKASKWADETQNVQVETGRYSAKHWALMAQASVTGSVTYRGLLSAANGIYPALPHLGDYYIISVTGLINSISYNAGDSIIYNGLTWDKASSGSIVSSVNGQTGVVVIAKSDVGLGSVNNTADATKPVSAAQAAAIALKENSANLAAVARSGSYADLTNKPSAYSLPNATTTSVGGVKSSASVVVDVTGVMTVTAASVGARPSSYVPTFAEVTGKPTTLAGYGITNAQVALGFTPYNVTNPSNFINAAGAPVQSVGGFTGVITKAQLGISNVDNTTDATKPVSAAQAAANNVVQSTAATDATTKANAAQAAAIAASAPSSHVGSGDAAHNAASTTTSGFLSAADKTKLDGIATSANAYTHPANHAASVITQDANNRFATDAEKSAWNAKQAALGFTPENAASKNATGGYPGMTLFKINLRNAANTFTSWLTNATTAARTWTMPDKDGTVAMLSDITGTNSGTNTGDETLATIKSKLSVAVLSGSNTGDQTNIAGNAATVTTNANLTGDVVSLGNATTIAVGSVTLDKMATVATGTFIGRVQAGTGNPEAIGIPAAKAMLEYVKGDVGLGSVDNTADASKPVSAAQQTALNLKADLASPTLVSPNLTGTPVAPTASAEVNTTQIATTAFVQAHVPDVVGVEYAGGGSGSYQMAIVKLPEGGMYSGANATTGAIKIGLPVAAYTMSSMLRMRVELWDYAINESITLLIAGYITSVPVWSNQTVTILSNRTDKNFTVRFGNDGTRSCIWIGELASTWAYPRIYISEVEASYNSNGALVNTWKTGWAISAVTAFDNVEDAISNNFPIAQGLIDSPALTGVSTASTAAAGTNTTQIATTAFVQKTSNGRLVKSVAGGSTVTLTAVEAGSARLAFTGVLTANIAVVVPNTEARWDVANLTTGAYTLTVKTVAGVGVVVTQALRTSLSCDAVSVFETFTDFKDIALTGVSTAPTAAPGTNTTQLASTQFATTAANLKVTTTTLAASGGAATVGNAPAGNIAATTVQDAINELDTEKAALAGATFTGNISAPVVTETSDERKKENWKQLNDTQLDALGAMQLVGVFDWRDGSGQGVGGSAQEIEAIVPKAVHTDKDGFKTVAYGGLVFAMTQGILRRMLEAK